jgi:two-component system sensor histidine kinase/response regulator
MNTARQTKTILIVEDSPTQAVHLQSALSHKGLEVLCAVNGRVGIRLAQEVHPDLIILDVQMPEVNGYEVARILKASPDTVDIPIIMFTRQDTPEAVQMGLQTGAVDYIPKDAFAHAVLLETIRQMGLFGDED